VFSKEVAEVLDVASATTAKSMHVLLKNNVFSNQKEFLIFIKV